MKAINTNNMKQYAARQYARFRDEASKNWREMVEADAPANTLATAFATGTLISTIPIPLVDMALAAFVTRRFSEMPRAPFLTGMALANNLVMAPLYASTPKVGALVLGWLASNTAWVAPDALLVRILVGYLLIALGLALGSFVLASTGFRGYKATRRRQLNSGQWPVVGGQWSVASGQWSVVSGLWSVVRRLWSAGRRLRSGRQRGIDFVQEAAGDTAQERRIA